MPNTSYRDRQGKLHTNYVNPFCIRCDACEDLSPSDWIDERCRYECENCRRDWQSEHAEDLEVAL
jgi:hypothetical protein